jgi:hypothetical protein
MKYYVLNWDLYLVFVKIYKTLPWTLLNCILFDLNHFSISPARSFELLIIWSHIYALLIGFLSSLTLRFILLFSHTSHLWMSFPGLGPLKSPWASGLTVMLINKQLGLYFLYRSANPSSQSTNQWLVHSHSAGTSPCAHKLVATW